MDRPKPTNEPVTPAARKRPFARAATVAVAALVLGATSLVGLAGADPTTDPGELVDTELTPSAKGGAAPLSFGWRQVAGAVFTESDDAKEQAEDMKYKDPVPAGGGECPSTEDARGCVPHSVNFFSVSFLNPDKGFAAGSACENRSAPDTELATCPRVPVIYEYARPAPNLPPEWRETYRGKAATGDAHGYVGAVAWIKSGKAVAVGGTGCYPRRDAASPQDKARACGEETDGNARTGGVNRAPGREEPVAGDAQVWVFENRAWSRVADQNLPAQMTGLTALTFSHRVGDCAASQECGFAGALGQVWLWRDGRFREPSGDGKSYMSTWLHCTPEDADPSSAKPECATPSTTTWDTPFRVRSIGVRLGTSLAPGQPAAAAVTSGCCYSQEVPNSGRTIRPATVNFPRIIANVDGAWRVDPMGLGTASFPVTDSAGRSAGRASSLPDSLYSVTFGHAQHPTNGGDERNCFSATAAYAGPSDAASDPFSAAEMGSTVLGPFGSCAKTIEGGPAMDHGSTYGPTAHPRLSSVRLVAGGADLEGHQPTATQKVRIQSDLQTYLPDGLMDWAVGEFKNHRAAAYTTTQQTTALDEPYPLSCPSDASLGVPGSPRLSGQCQADANAANQLTSNYLFQLPSYSLNAMTTLAQSGVSWAAGDRGALLRLGGPDAAGAAADSPPKLGGGDVTRLSNREAFDAFRPTLSDDVGVVPPLSAQPLTDLPSGQLEPYGSPDPAPTPPDGVSGIAMSRDGSEGWAVGPNRAQYSNSPSTLFHFDGERWTRCDQKGIEGILPPDPACRDLADLAPTDGGMKFLTVTRVPTEHGDDASRANDFEVVAAATYGNNTTVRNAILRYRDGEWKLDEDWSQQLTGMGGIDLLDIEIAFGTPEDGWIITNGIGPSSLFHLVDGTWVRCDSGAAWHPECEDPSQPGVVPMKAGDFTAASAAPNISGMHLTTLGSRVYLYGTRGEVGGNQDKIGPFYPVILYRESKKDGPWTAEYDPKNGVGCDPCGDDVGYLNALSLAKADDGSVTGWGVGAFGPQASNAATRDVLSHSGVERAADSSSGGARGLDTPLLHWSHDDKQWSPVKQPGPAAREYLLPPALNRETIQNPSYRSQIVSLAGPGGSGSAIAARDTGVGRPDRPMVWMNPDSGRWEPLGTPFTMSYGNTDGWLQAVPQALAPDGQGGAWIAAKSGANGTWFYRHRDKARQPVFSDVPHPIREPITATAAGGDGSFWVATESGNVYRYDRLTGWDRATLKGWDAGGVVQSPAYGIAVGPDGNGVVVGKAGRIAEIGPRAVRLDPSAILCSASARCATTRTLRAVAVASDGSALAGGEARSVVWRGVSGGFQPVSAPEVSRAATITSISMPSPTRAWLTTDTGEVMAGSLTGADWSWRPEAVDAEGNSLTQGRALRGIAIDGSGHGYAVGARGVLLERSTDGTWKRLPGFGGDLTSITLGPGGKGALVGGVGGLLLTKVSDRFVVARSDDNYDPRTSGSDPSSPAPVVGVAVLPGHEAGQVEAWAATQVGKNARTPAPGALLHYTSDPDDPLLAAGAGRAAPLPDAPEPREDELEIAAFGKSDCQLTSPETCPELMGNQLTNDVIARRVRDAVIGGDRRPDLAVFTGGANDAGGTRQPDLLDDPTASSLHHERWGDVIADPFGRAGVPLYGALGGQDLSRVRECDPLVHNPSNCQDTRQLRTGVNLGWRQANAGRPAPWGSSRVRAKEGLTFRPVTGGVDTNRLLSGTPAAGARTHYAVDVIKEGKKVLRLVVLDTSLKTVGGAAVQNPVEEQLTWLDQVLTGRGRAPGQLAVVVSETPSYAYNPSAGATTDTLLDSTAFEALMVKNRVDAVISGRLGWNGLYWLVAPGLHTPCPGGNYQEDPPRDASQVCQAAGDDPAATADNLAQTLGDTLGAPVPKPSDELRKQVGLANIPVAVAASAGGKFGPDGSGAGSGSQGFWRGYTTIRLSTTRSHRAVIEQRPVFDWIGIQAAEHTLVPGRTLTLRGYGREPVGIDQPFRYVDIDGPAITHRYDLVLADPDKPYLPKVDPTSDEPHHYVRVPDGIGATVDRQTGVIRYRGRGNHPPIHALAILSVGEQTATWPIVLAPRRSFKAPAPPLGRRIVLPLPPLVKGTAPAAIPNPPSTPIPNPPKLDLTFPPPPTLPNLSLNAPQTQPPPPPPPPPPPVSPAASALQIAPAPVGLNVAPPATVIPPPAPPIQPAPPGGARREARQKQAAVAKSEEGGGEGAGESSENGGESSSYSRLDQPRDLAFTAHERRAQPSAWSNALLWGGGLGGGALILALGWSTLRPGPRRRQPDVPAPAWVRSSDRRR